MKLKTTNKQIRANFYKVFGNFCISTGYRPIGEDVNYTLLQDLEKQAKNICLDYELNRETKEKQINELINKLINSVNK